MENQQLADDLNVFYCRFEKARLLGAPALICTSHIPSLPPPPLNLCLDRAGLGRKSALAHYIRSNATHLCTPLNNYTNSYSIKALKWYIIVIECIWYFILHMPIAQPPLPKHFHHIHNTLQYLPSLSHLFPMSRHLTMLLISAFEHLRKKSFSTCFVCNALFMLLYALVKMSPIWHSSNECCCQSSQTPYTQNNAWCLSQYVSPFLLVPSSQINRDPAQLDFWYSVVGGNLKIFVNQKDGQRTK